MHEFQSCQSSPTYLSKYGGGVQRVFNSPPDLSSDNSYKICISISKGILGSRFPFLHHLHHHCIYLFLHMRNTAKSSDGLLLLGGERTLLILLDTAISEWFYSEVSLCLVNTSKQRKPSYLHHRKLWKTSFICLPLIIQSEIQGSQMI